MSADRAGTGIPGVRWRRVERHADARGSFRELWREDDLGAIEPTDARLDAAEAAPRFRQANVSTSAPGVLRGLHVHRRQLDHWVVLSGRAVVALVDIRPMLAGAARPTVETRVAEPDDTVVIPAGVAHGFLALEELALAYLVTARYDGTDELGFAWDDPLAGVPWPAVPARPHGRPILSERDRANPSLDALLAVLRAG